MGIGINANLDKNDFSDDLQEKATSLKIAKGHAIKRNQLLALILNHFEKLYDSFKEDLNLRQTIEICRKYSALIGKEIQLIDHKTTRLGRAIDINDEGELLVKFKDGIEHIYSGEVSVRGLDNYI